MGGRICNLGKINQGNKMRRSAVKASTSRWERGWGVSLNAAICGRHHQVTTPTEKARKLSKPLPFYSMDWIEQCPS